MSNVYVEELFHAYQNDNKSEYGSGDFNIEFEAKVAVTAIGSESQAGYQTIDSFKEFQEKVGIGDYGNEENIITSKSINSENFLNEYIKAANDFATFNRENNYGNSNYKTSTNTSPASLIKMVEDANK